MTIRIATKLALAKRTENEADTVRAHARSLERIDHPHARAQHAAAKVRYKEARRLRCEALVDLVAHLETRGEVVVLRHVMYEIAKAAQAVGVTVECWDERMWTLRGRDRVVTVALDEQRATMTLEGHEAPAIDVAFTPEEVEQVVERTPEPVRIESPEQVADAVAEVVDKAKWNRARRRWFAAVRLVVDEDQAEEYRGVVKTMLGVGSFRDLHAEELWRESNRVIAMAPTARRVHILECIGYLAHAGGVAA